MALCRSVENELRSQKNRDSAATSQARLGSVRNSRLYVVGCRGMLTEVKLDVRDGVSRHPVGNSILKGPSTTAPVLAQH